MGPEGIQRQVDESFEERETRRLEGMPFRTKEWFLPLRLSDETVDKVPLVPAGDFIMTMPQQRDWASQRLWVQTIQYLADVSNHMGFQTDYRYWRDTISRAFNMAESRRRTECDSIHIAIKREFDSSRGIWGPWEATLNGACMCWFEKPVIARANPDACDSDPGEILSRLGSIDGKSMVLLTWFGNYDWSPEMKTWVNTMDMKPWWESISEWFYGNEDACLFGSVDSWMLMEDTPEGVDGGKSRVRHAASQYSGYEDAYESLSKSGKKATSSTMGTLRLSRDNKRSDDDNR